MLRTPQVGKPDVQLSLPAIRYKCVFATGYPTIDKHEAYYQTVALDKLSP